MTAKRRTELDPACVFPSDIEPGITAVTGEDYYGTSLLLIDLNDTSRKTVILTGPDADITKPNCPNRKIGFN